MINLHLKEILGTKYVQSIVMLSLPSSFQQLWQNIPLQAEKDPGRLDNSLAQHQISTSTFICQKGGTRYLPWNLLHIQGNSPGRCTHVHLHLLWNQGCSSHFLSYSLISYVRQEGQWIAWIVIFSYSFVCCMEGRKHPATFMIEIVPVLHNAKMENSSLSLVKWHQSPAASTLQVSWPGVLTLSPGMKWFL